MFDASPRPELLALLAAVKAEPDDDTRKLALADWLQEQDHDADHARGEFLRGIVRYHRLDEDDPDRVGLAGGLSALWKHYHPAWLGPLPAAGFRLWGYLSAGRGLLVPSIEGRQVVAKAAAAAAGSAAYAWVGGLNFFQLSGGQLTRFARSPLLDSLVGLRLSECYVTARSVADLVNNPRAAGLKSLDLGKVSAPVESIAASPHLAGLRELRLWQSRVGDAAFKALCDSPHLNELRVLDVSSNELTIHAARAFADGTGLPALTALDLGGSSNHIGPDGALILVHKPNAGRLRKLSFWSIGIADYGVEAICRQPHMNKLTHLDLSGNLLTNRAAVALAGAEHLKTLEVLNLKTNGISGDGALALAGSPHLANLRRLDLSGNRFGAKAAAALCERFGDRVTLD